MRDPNAKFGIIPEGIKEQKEIESKLKGENAMLLKETENLKVDLKLTKDEIIKSDIVLEKNKKEFSDSEGAKAEIGEEIATAKTDLIDIKNEQKSAKLKLVDIKNETASILSDFEIDKSHANKKLEKIKTDIIIEIARADKAYLRGESLSTENKKLDISMRGNALIIKDQIVEIKTNGVIVGEQEKLIADKKEENDSKEYKGKQLDTEIDKKIKELDKLDKDILAKHKIDIAEDKKIAKKKSDEELAHKERSKMIFVAEKKLEHKKNVIEAIIEKAKIEKYLDENFKI